MKVLESQYLYFFLLLFTISYPLAQSFERRIQLYKKFKYIGFSIISILLVFTPWDIYFTKKGVWWFNTDYITGLQIYNLPIEEILFFLCVPFACIFIYEVLNYFIKTDLLHKIARPFLMTTSIILVFTSILFNHQLYTFVCFLITGIAILIVTAINPKWLSRFLLAYLVSLIPLLLVNGILTGSLIESPVVNYNPNDIIGLRIITIPIEDFVYNLFMFLVMISVYEKSSSFYRLKS